ncbi:ABC transporter permease [Komagataeibacter medellinensis]|uniref:ABC transporter permease n=1 Tax=Komagataeibacter medellinensis TaxID=1177712 RepID=A0ABQ6VXJ4_9PROT|nr:ABC transporter permease [Komagataeibacter medellinensis]KAB8124895.1 ABC transporter permease [Komagataeibacter medellinensis]
MSRLVTLFFAVVAAVSGLFLYNKKQQTTALDHQIAQIVEQTEHTRSQTAMLRAEWAMLNQPDRLGTLASRYDRGLQPVTPTQFVQMAALADHMPAVGSQPAHPAPAPRATMVATLAADHVQATMHDAAVAPVSHAPPPAPTPVPVAAHTPAPRHAEPQPVAHDALARALAQNDTHNDPRPAPRMADHVRAPERVAVAEPPHTPTLRDSIVSGPRVTTASYHPHTTAIADAAWHPAAAPRLMGSSSLGTPHVTALPPPVPVSN